ncbi:hypothetical protein Asi03nite_12340 [Actinoplanes siamensis]|uniref:Uncharacterized protein n=1 Tax=Actinoplanes siamensis TaxID=1223317 RepID=A0A919TH40_9ACTN|nr:hypothetical protein Asi03nite_12340 [Actinoplanes siamensis]
MFTRAMSRHPADPGRPAGSPRVAPLLRSCRPPYPGGTRRPGREAAAGLWRAAPLRIAGQAAPVRAGRYPFVYPFPFGW